MFLRYTQYTLTMSDMFSQDLLPVYQDTILPLADVCLPNQFEAELLTGEKIESEEDALAVMETIHSKGVGTVILSSTELGSDTHLVGLASQNKEGRKTVVKVGTDCHACVLHISPCRFLFLSFLQLLWGLGTCSQL